MEPLDNEFSEYLAIMGKGFGLHDIMLNVFSVLFLEPEDMAMEDIAKKTGYSLASISNTMKMLENIGFVERRRKPGTKKVFFYMGKNVIKWNINKIMYASENMLKPAKERLPAIIKEYKSRAKTERDKKKVTIVQDYYNQLLMFEGIIGKWKKDLEKLI